MGHCDSCSEKKCSLTFSECSICVTFHVLELLFVLHFLSSHQMRVSSKWVGFEHFGDRTGSILQKLMATLLLLEKIGKEQTCWYNLAWWWKWSAVWGNEVLWRVFCLAHIFYCPLLFAPSSHPLCFISPELSRTPSVKCISAMANYFIFCPDALQNHRIGMNWEVKAIWQSECFLALWTFNAFMLDLFTSHKEKKNNLFLWGNKSHTSSYISPASNILKVNSSILRK